MYIARHFMEDDPETLHEIMRENGFALLVSSGGDEPMATHLPLTLDTDGAVTLCGHMAKANHHLEILARNSNAMAVFWGPHAYVSPSWYETGPAVPTWNYVAVHAYGNVSLVDDPAELEAMVSDMVHEYEDERETPWRMEDLPEDFRARQLNGIVGFRMKIDRLEGKLKLSQNRPAADGARVANALMKSPSAGDHAAAHAMQRYGAVVGDD